MPNLRSLFSRSGPFNRIPESFGIDVLEKRLVLSGAWTNLPAQGELTGPATPVSVLEWNDFEYRVASGSWLISFKEKTGGGTAAELAARQVATALGVPVKSAMAVGRYWAEFTTTSAVTQKMIDAALTKLPGVKQIEPNRVYNTTQVPNDERYSEQYMHDNTGTFLGSLGKLDADIDTPDAWDTTIGSHSQVVAVVDTGVQWNHPDLADNIYANPGEIPGNGIDDDNNGFTDDVRGWDFWDNENNPNDEEGHGTHVAGIIGAVGNNGIGVVGVNWTVSLLPIRVLGPFGGTIASIVGGIDYVTMLRESGVPIAAANASYGAPGSRFYEDTPEGFDAEKDAIAMFIQEGGTFVAAAGNDNNDNDTENSSFFPAAYKIPGLISVAATDWDDRRASFSNYGAETVDLGAPGDFLLSTFPTDSYAYLSGTSMAAPVVSGAVSLIRSIKPNASAPEIRQTLIDSVDPVPDLQGRTVSGGRLNVARALQIAGLTGPIVQTVLPGPVTGQVNPATNTPLKTLTLRFNRPIDADKLFDTLGDEDASNDVFAFKLVRDGADNAFDTGDDGEIRIASVVRSDTDHREVTITLNLNNQPSQRLPIDSYRLTMFAERTANVGILDTDGNYLNGNSIEGQDETYFFNVVAVSGTYEVNDTLATATNVNFSASGTAKFTGVTIGDGIQGPLDVDLFKLDLIRGGQITAEITAKRLATGSSLDSYLRLFDANGNLLTSNDQFYGQDSFIDYYVSTGGTYYLGVSGFGNESYDVDEAGSGNAQSTGLYSLSIVASLNTDDMVSEETDFDTALRIPATGTQGVITSEIQVTDLREILDANVQVRIQHTFMSDLRVTLISPSGTEVVLSNRRGGSEANMTPTLFDDEAPQDIADGDAPFAGTFRPDESLGQVDGQTALGTWTLKIEDLSGTNFGFLDGWRLDLHVQNDVFGDFEPNDTIPNARDLTQISGAGFGNANVSAFLGDGGFGLLDRDFYKISVNAGASMTVAVFPQGNVDTALRLFNAQGEQVVLAIDPASNASRIDNFVFNDAGVYYLAVSSGVNTAYDPYSVAGGVAMTSTGTYSMVVSVANGVSDGAINLVGENVSVGLNTEGNLFSGNTGLEFNGIDFLYGDNGPAQQFFGAAADGTVFQNSERETQLAFALTDQSDSFNSRGVARALFNGNLRIERSVSFGKTDHFAVVDVLLTNQGASSIASLSWMEGFNPEMGLNLDPETEETFNDIDGSGRMATARYTNNSYIQGLTIGLAAPSADARASAMFISQSIVDDLRDPTQLLELTPTDPDGAASDQYMSLVYDLGTVTPGQSVSMRYFVFFGTTPTAVDSQYAVLNAGAGTGHLTADASSPATETLEDGSEVAQLPYRYYFPEGFATPNTNTFIPILNLNDQSAHVVVIARYESGVRDQLLADFTGSGEIPANSRSGITITNPFMFGNGTQLVRPYEGYAVEVRSDRPISPTFSHYDTNLTTTAASIGEAFTTRVSDTWTFSEVTRGGSNRDFILFYNTSDQTTKVETTFYPQGGGEPILFTQTVEGHRRLGLNLHLVAEVPEGVYGVKVSAQTPIVAVVSHYDIDAHTAEGVSGLPSLGSQVGATSEGDLGRNATSEKFTILNASNFDSEVSLVFLFGSGSSYRTVVEVDSQSQFVVDVGSLPAFPVGQQYSMQYTSDQPVSVQLVAEAFGDQLISGLTDRAYSYWGFGEGFKPRDGNPLVNETLRLYNPSSTDTIAEIVLRYDLDQGSESLRIVVPARKAFSVNVHDLVTGSRRLTEVFYGITVKSAAPIIASFTHSDAFFPGAFSTLGTPMGEGEALT